jgi:hyperosmotically inducible periplasmic protein
MKRTIAIVVATAALSIVACKKPQEEGGTAAASADNTLKNERDRDNATMLPTDQGGSQSDRDITARVRRDVVADGNLGMKAKNVKIITKDGTVTLRGPVATPEERTLVANYAKQAAGVTAVIDQIEIAEN